MNSIEKQVEEANKQIEVAKESMAQFLQHNYGYGTSMQTVKIYSRGGESYIPQYKTQGASGLDIMAYIKEPMTIQPFERVLVPTGLYVDLPDDYEIQIRPRSGAAWKKGLSVPNTPGTIDDDYVDEIKVLLINLSNENQTIEPGERIAQMVFAKVDKLQWEQVDSPEDFTSKDRIGGFGSTGIK